jgi:hypothetical protein
MQDRKSLNDYNLTILNAPIMDVFMEIKRDLAYRRPRPILSQPNSQFADQYCAFHDATEHRTEACISLRILIELFIENGKLVWFLVDQRNPTNPECDNHPREEYNRVHQNQGNLQDDWERPYDRARKTNRWDDVRERKGKSMS